MTEEHVLQKMNREQQLQKVSKLISIDDEREQYAEYYDAVRDYVLAKMCLDPIFKSLFNGTELSGSCADKVKITKPDEYDCYVYLKLEELKGITVLKGSQSSTAHVRMNRMSANNGAFEKLKTFTNSNGDIIPQKLNSWIQGLIAREIPSSPSTMKFNNGEFEMWFSQNGPAQTVQVKLQNKRFAIDFVPSIKLYSKSCWISDRSPVNFDGQQTYWNLVLKPNQNDVAAFKTSFTKMESALIKDKNQLKNVLRLLKKLRDKNQLTLLKSYFIKTVCLWVDSEERSSFWEQPTYDVLLVVLKKLIWFCDRRNLACFWDKHENMLSKIGESQMIHIVSVLSGELRRLVKGIESIPKVFFNEKEMNLYRNQF